MKVHYPKLYNMAHLLSLNVLLLPKDLTIIFSLQPKTGKAAGWGSGTAYRDIKSGGFESH